MWRLMDVETGGVSGLEEKLVCSFKIEGQVGMSFNCRQSPVFYC